MRIHINITKLYTVYTLKAKKHIYLEYFLLYLAEEKNGLGSLDIGLREDITHVLHFYHGTDARPQLNKFYYTVLEFQL
jgi:hypothetical protein